MVYGLYSDYLLIKKQKECKTLFLFCCIIECKTKKYYNNYTRCCEKLKEESSKILNCAGNCNVDEQQKPLFFMRRCWEDETKSGDLPRINGGELPGLLFICWATDIIVFIGRLFYEQSL